MQSESHFERTEKTIPLKPETEEAIRRLYKPKGKKPKVEAGDEFGKIIASSPETAWLSQEELDEESGIASGRIEMKNKPKESKSDKEKAGDN